MLVSKHCDIQTRVASASRSLVFFNLASHSLIQKNPLFNLLVLNSASSSPQQWLQRREMGGGVYKHCGDHP
ncbi:hypothetical protein EV10_0487 [Prochlorococcus marinus str. SS51]|nr:hypothetical protein EV04_0685 [Prochlorococcus marinus str. LG]KGG24363.1 hypothetical protein EV09_0410 [Prochlorococcus marinus str. SS35]KGG33647.1 hypothetical protein EV10_0487 [Prochlorococcus marinus str. SS51]